MAHVDASDAIAEVNESDPAQLGALPKKRAKAKAKKPTADGDQDHFAGVVHEQQLVIPPHVEEISNPEVDVAMEALNAEGAMDPGAELPSPIENQLGCPRCYLSPSGCAVCKKPGYKMRVTREQAMAKIREQLQARSDRRVAAAKAKAKAKAKASVKKTPKAPGPGKARGRPRKS